MDSTEIINNLTTATTTESESLSFPPDSEAPKVELNIYYTVCEILVAIFAVVGNAMVIIVFRKERRLRRRTNYYIVSLAAADLLVGLLGIPFAVMASVGLPTNLYACLFTVSLLVVLCTISIFCLVAVSVDRYWAILHPMAYSRNVRTKTALVIISICWVSGSFVGFLPLLGWHRQPEHDHCLFVDVMDYNYLVFLYFATIITPSLVLLAFYAHIYRVVLKQLRQIVTMNPVNVGNGSSSNRTTSSGGTMLRMLGAAQKREVKATQNLSIIVLFFMICWLPLYTINCVQAFCPSCTVDETLMYLCIILSHLNSAGNPVLYAYHLKDFRAALKSLLYNMFGQQVPPNPADLQCRPSIASNLCFNQYNNSLVQRRQSFRETRSSVTLSQQNKLYSESPILFTNRLSKSINLPTPPRVSSLVTNAAAVVALTTVKKSGREMFKITEASFSEHESSQTDENNGVNKIQLKRSVSVSSIDGRIEPLRDNGRIVEDDVFLVTTGGGSENPNFTNETENSRSMSLHVNCPSCSTSQLSRSLVSVDDGITISPADLVRSCSEVEDGRRDKNTHFTSLKVVEDFLLTHSLKHSYTANRYDEGKKDVAKMNLDQRNTC